LADGAKARENERNCQARQRETRLEERNKTSFSIGALGVLSRGVIIGLHFLVFGFSGKPVGLVNEERETHIHTQISEIAVSKAVFNFQCSFSLLTFDI
jgi:hypothetical protein